MARTQGSTARIQRLTSLVAVVLVGVSVGFAFGRVFIGRGTTYEMIAAGVGAGVLAWAFERRSLLLATVASLALLIVTLALMVFPETLWYGLPTLDTLAAMRDAAAAVGEEARARVSPAEPVPALVFASITAVWAAVFSCHALAIRAGSPLLALLPPLALIAFADSVLSELVKPAYGVLFLVAALAIMFADSIRRVQGWGPVWSGPGRRSHFLSATGRSARRIGFATVVLAVAAPFLLPGFGSKAVIDISASGDDGAINVSPLVNVAAALTNGDKRDVFEVESDQPANWRMTALEVFDGTRWLPDEGGAEPASAGTVLGTGDGTEQVTTTFTVVNELESFPWLPVPYLVSGVAVDRDVSWSPDTATITVPEGLDEGDAITVRSTFKDLTAEELDDMDIPPSPLPELLELPDDIQGELAQIAEEWTAGETSPFDKALAIQERLARSGFFRYDPRVAPREDADALLDFLQTNRAGFCQQFATAMAALLRSIGIPARVAVGFTTGEEIRDDPAEEPSAAGSPVAEQGEGPTRYMVSTDQLHAWVEVEFAEAGWVAFEPTPGRAAPAYGAPPAIVGGPAEPCDLRNPRFNPCTPSSSATPGPDRPIPSPQIDNVDTPGSTPTEERALPVPLLVGTGLALLLVLGIAAVPIAHAIRRRHTLRKAANEPRKLILATYDITLERAGELGLPREAAETPAEYLTKVTASGRLEDGHLERLTETTVRAAYGAAEPTRDDALDATGDASEVLDELRRSSSVRDRVIGPFLRRLR